MEFLTELFHDGTDSDAADGTRAGVPHRVPADSTTNVSQVESTSRDIEVTALAKGWGPGGGARAPWDAEVPRGERLGDGAALRGALPSGACSLASCAFYQYKSDANRPSRSQVVDSQLTRPCDSSPRGKQFGQRLGSEVRRGGRFVRVRWPIEEASPTTLRTPASAGVPCDPPSYVL